MTEFFDILYFAFIIVVFVSLFIFIFSRTRKTSNMVEYSIKLSEEMAKRQVESIELLKAILEESKKTNQLLAKKDKVKP